MATQGDDADYKPRKRKSMFDVVSVDDSTPSNSILNSINLILSNIIPVWTPATDQAFKSRLTKALTKNFDYIDK